MRRLIMWNFVTPEGFFEGPRSWDLGFHEQVWGEELERLAIEQLDSADLEARPLASGVILRYAPDARG